MNIKTPLLSALSLATCLVLLGGCAVGPNYKKPALSTPATYRFATGAATNSFADLPWWQVFKDPNLHGLIHTALTNNYDLKQAVARVEQARNQATIARAPFFPQINYGGNVGRGKNALFNSPVPLGGATESSASLAMGAAWEIDIWGRIRRLSEAAQAQYLATEEARRAVTISLVSEVAITYFQLLQLDQELLIQRDATNSFAESFRIFDQRRINGVASKLETDRAAAAQANAAALIPLLELNIALTENQLNVLLGRHPGPIGRTNTLGGVQLQPEIPAGLPGDLLRRRPDILAREQSLIAANANIGASFANFFPQIGLTTFFGKVSPELSAFSSGSANAWNVGATMAGPLFQGGQLRAQYQVAKARFEEAKAAYEQSVLTGFQEVSNSLIARQQFMEQSGFSAQAVEALKSAVELAMQRYQTGRSSYFEVLQAQQELYPTQRSQVQTEANALIAVVQLYRALGGGWTPEVTDVP